MAITIPNATVETFSSPTATSHTVNLPTFVADDVCYIVIAGNPDGTGTVPAINIPSGWTQIGAQLAHGAASDGILAIIRRVMQGGDASTVTVTTTQTCMMAAIATAYRGVDTGTPEDAAAPTFATGTSPPVSPSITTVTDNARVCYACLIDGAPTFGDGDIPSGSTLRGTMVNNPPSNGQNLGSADENQATLGASGTASWTNGGTEEYVAATFAIRPQTAGITGVTPSEFDFDNADVDIDGSNFEATQSSGSVYISDASTLAGSANEVQINNSVITWSDTVINLDFTALAAAKITSLHTLGPGARYIIVTNASADEYSFPITLHRPDAIDMVLSANFAPSVTTARITGMSGTFGGGRIEEALNPSATNTNVANDGNREDVWNIQLTPASREVIYDFRVLYGGIVSGTITQTPQVTGDFETAVLAAGTITVIGTAIADATHLSAGTSTFIGTVISTATSKVFALGTITMIGDGVAVGTSLARGTITVLGEGITDATHLAQATRVHRPAHRGRWSAVGSRRQHHHWRPRCYRNSPTDYRSRDYHSRRRSCFYGETYRNHGHLDLHWRPCRDCTFTRVRTWHDHGHWRSGRAWNHQRQRHDHDSWAGNLRRHPSGARHDHRHRGSGCRAGATVRTRHSNGFRRPCCAGTTHWHYCHQYIHR
jgi:hypothetical protein